MTPQQLFAAICKQIQTLKNEWQIKATEYFIEDNTLLSREQKQDLLCLLETKQNLLPQLN